MVSLGVVLLDGERDRPLEGDGGGWRRSIWGKEYSDGKIGTEVALPNGGDGGGEFGLCPIERGF